VDDQIISLTAKIVSAYVGANDMAAVQISGLIREAYQALATVGQPPVEPPAPEPAVATQKSVFAERLVCLDCGGSFKSLKRHLSADHQLTPDEYRTKWRLPPSYPMVAAEYAASRSAFAKATGLGRKVEASPPPKKKAVRPKGRQERWLLTHPDIADMTCRNGGRYCGIPVVSPQLASPPKRWDQGRIRHSHIGRWC
jgi:predicted transcriptional regulator